MTFTIPDVAAAWNPIQARIQSGDITVLAEGSNGVGMASGGAVTAQASPNMTVAVASGTARIGGANVTVTSGNVTITANATGQPRLDLVCVNASGTKSAQAGTAAASPKYPAIPASSAVLAAVLVPTGAASITNNNIVDKRVFVASTTGLVAANNLSDVASVATARTNLGTVSAAAFPVVIGVAVSDETTTLSGTGTKLTMRMPHAMTVTAVRSQINTVSSSGLVTVDINEGGTTILSTKLSIDQGEKTSTTAATPAVISDSALADDAEITFDLDATGTGAKGLKVFLIGTRSV